ncbi:MAG: hypothetical protein ACOYOP_16660 [Microthrixaceae bacterium]
MGEEPPLTAGARHRLREAAAAMLAEPTLADLTAFVTVTRLTEATGLSRGAASRAFEEELARLPHLTAPQVVARSAFLDPPGARDVMGDDTLVLLEAVLEQAEAGPVPLPEVVARLVAAPAAAGANGASAHEFTRDWLALAVCHRDEEVRTDLVRSYAGYRRVYAGVIERLLAVMDRETVPGVDVGELSSIITACLDGLVGRLRREPESGEEPIVRALLGLWGGLTRPVGTQEALVDTHVAAVGRPRRMAEEDEANIARAAVELYRRHGWSSVLLASVAATAPLPVNRLLRSRPDRRHLAPLVWADLAGRLVRSDPSSTESGPGTDGHGAGAGPPEDGAESTDRAAALAALACRHRAACAALVQVRCELAEEPGETPAAGETDEVVAELAGWLAGDERAVSDAPVSAGRAVAAVETALTLAASPADLDPGVVAVAVRAVVG